ncbi:Draxin-B-like [Arapaima gigas]
MLSDAGRRILLLDPEHRVFEPGPRAPQATRSARSCRENGDDASVGGLQCPAPAGKVLADSSLPGLPLPYPPGYTGRQRRDQRLPEITGVTSLASEAHLSRLTAETLRCCCFCGAGSVHAVGTPDDPPPPSNPSPPDPLADLPLGGAARHLIFSAQRLRPHGTPAARPPVPSRVLDLRPDLRVGLCSEMAALTGGLGLLLVLLHASLAVSSSLESGSRLPKRAALASPGGAPALQDLDLWVQPGSQPYWRGGPGSGGLLSHRSPRLLWGVEDSEPELEGLTPVKLERGRQGEVENDFFRLRAPSSESVAKRWKHRLRSGYEKLKGLRGPVHRGEGDLPQVMLPSDLKEAEFSKARLLRATSTVKTAAPTVAPSPTVITSSISLVTTVTCEEPPVLPPASAAPKKPPAAPAPWKAHGEVMPTLDMTLFDWTDYEDLRPADARRSPKKKDKRPSKNLKPGNVTVDTEPMMSCDHHLDCKPGSCCDLRNHVCTPHNRGLNNKCYDDCMCEEGFRCYAKFHRKRRVTRRRGRCVEPELADREHGAFVNI